MIRYLHSYYEELDYMYYRIFNNNRIIESRGLRSIIDEQLLLAIQHGFDFLNSNQNDELFENIKSLKKSVLNTINDKNLFRINRLEKEIIEKREYGIIGNIYSYSKEYTYNRAILYIGSGQENQLFVKLKNIK